MRRITWVSVALLLSLAAFSLLTIASLTDLPLIEKARTQAQQLFDSDPDLQRPEDKLLGEAKRGRCHD